MKNNKQPYFLIVLCFLFYLGILFYLTMLSESYGRTGTHNRYRYNLQLFHTIQLFVKYQKHVGMKAAMVNLLGNVVAFVPFGFFVPVLRKRPTNIILILLLSFELSLLIEVLQLILRVGSFDVDDLLLNTIGGIAGYLCYCLWGRMKIWWNKNGK